MASTMSSEWRRVERKSLHAMHFETCLLSLASLTHCATMWANFIRESTSWSSYLLFGFRDQIEKTGVSMDRFKLRIRRQ